VVDVTVLAEDAAGLVSAARRASLSLDLWSGEPDEVVLLEHSWKSAVLRATWRRPRRRAIVLKRCDPASAEVETSVYEDVLPLLPLAAPRLFGVWRDDRATWLALEDLGDEPPELEDARQREAISRWLGELHVASRELPAVPALPDRSTEHYAGLLASARGRLCERQAEALEVEEARRLGWAIRLCDALLSAWEAVSEQAALLPPAFVHADMAPENLRVVRLAGRFGVAAIDWEKAGVGTPCADLAMVDPSAYADAAGASLEAVSSSMWVARLLGALSHNWASKPMGEVERYGHRVERALRSIDAL
jgi:aminoglycoside phosphotransferase (APT) family kinase protein